ncbi:glycosyltransferase family 2 protein [Christiangramia aquimixticola]|uniref:glycosyltransferase family 2 protein n=1 Tax=Christiangramia aquimixticola TaxID=1697558 RepID=UPI003AA82D15
MKEELVSIIIPTYNRAHLIGETLDSIIAQSYRQWECLIVDDHSTDYTEELLQFYTTSDPRIKYFKRPAKKPKGANACRNYGFEKSIGEFVNWFDSDDLMHSEKLKLQVKAITNKPYNFSVCQILVFENSDKIRVKTRHPKIYSKNALDDYISIKIVFLTPSVLWKREFIASMDVLFQEDLQAAQEWEFFSRCLFKSPDYHYIKKSLVFVRQHLNSISYSNDEQRHLHYFKAREKVFKYLKSKNYFSKYLSNYFLSFYRINLLKGDFVCAFKILKNQLIIDKKLNPEYKLKLVLAFFSYLIFGRGEILLKNTKPNNS